MSVRTLSAALALLCLSSGATQAEHPLAPRPVRGAQPLLYIKVQGPAGMHVTVYQGSTRGHSFPTPATLGIRPGYIYRMEVSGIPGYPGVSLFPTLEARGTVCLPAQVNPREFPAPVILTQEDIAAVARGVLLTKVIYLEHPDRAAPLATTPEEPQEITMPGHRDLLAEAQDLGRPVLVLRMGQRLMTAEAMARESIPGTVLLPGEKSLPFPRVGPTLAWAAWPWYDPVLGPKPFEEECIHNGGISASRGVWPLGTPEGMRPGLDQAGRLRGLQPENAVAEYVDSRGRKHLICSNKVCLCVPRFAILRRELPLFAHNTTIRLTGAGGIQGQELMAQRLPSVQTHQYDHLKGIQGRKRPSSTLVTQGVLPIQRIEVLRANVIVLGPYAQIGTQQAQQLSEVERTRLLKQVHLALELNVDKGTAATDVIQGTAVVGRVENGPEVIEAIAETRNVTVCCHEAPAAPDKPLTLFKWVDKKVAEPGEIATFYLRYTNQGGRPMTDVAVTDSLSSRLEYVPGTSRSERDAVFTTQENEAGSQILRWEISGRLLPGQSGVVSFKARVR